MSEKITFPGLTPTEAGKEAGVSASRVRQLAASGEIDHTYFGRSLVITKKGLQQIKERKTKRGPTPRQ